MAGSGSIGGSRQGNLGWLWGLIGGFILGVPTGMVAPRALHRLHGAPPPAPKAARAAAPANSRQMLTMVAEPKQHGVLLSAPQPLHQVRPSKSKLSRQQSNGFFTGFLNWPVTTNYLANGTGEFLLRSEDGADVATGWNTAGYKALIAGKPLQAAVKSGQTYTLYFQRKGQHAVDLGTFSVGGE